MTAHDVQLVSTKRVLDLVEATPEAAFYLQTDEETGEQLLATVLPFDLWAELGRPSQITVTVEPGDALNGKAPF